MLHEAESKQMDGGFGPIRGIQKLIYKTGGRLLFAPSIETAEKEWAESRGPDDPEVGAGAHQGGWTTKWIQNWLN